MKVDVLDKDSARAAVKELRPLVHQKRRELRKLEDVYRVLSAWAAQTTGTKPLDD